MTKRLEGTQPQFARWIRRQGLANHQITMAAILYAVNGYDSAAEFVRHCQIFDQTLQKGILPDENQPRLF